MNLDENKKSEQGKILLVDDTPANLEFIIFLLNKENYTTKVSVNGYDALRDAVELEPDIILMDVMMPGIDGFETCRKLKEIPTTQHIPVIFMSALSDAIVKVKGFDAGGVDYITKPVEIKELLVRIKAHQSVSKMEQKLVNANKLLAAAQDKLTLLKNDYERYIDEQIELNRNTNRALLNSLIGFWKWDLATDEVTYSREMYYIFDLDNDELEKNVPNIIPKNIHPEDVNKLVELNKSILNGEMVEAINYRIINSSGESKYIFRKCELDYDDENHPKAIFGIDQDITSILKFEPKNS